MSPHALTTTLRLIISILRKLFRAGEVQYYRRRLTDPQDHVTREIPTVSMYEMTGARKYLSRAENRAPCVDMTAPLP
jgi:hypothetical protein